jgi:hypothetical protein
MVYRLVTGVVVNSSTKMPVAGASVAADQVQTVTDASGRFQLRVLPGMIAVRIAAAG